MKHPGGVVDHLRRGLYKGIKAGELEVRQTRNGTGTTIYVRSPKGAS